MIGPNFFAAASGGGGGGSDPFFSSVKLLMHADGADGGTTFTDSSSTFTLSAQGATLPTTSNLQSKFGGTSARLTANSNTRIEIVSGTNSGFDFAGGDFTIEFWAYRDNAGAGDRHMLDAWGGRFLFRYSGSTLQFFAAGVGSPILSASQTWNTGAWRFLTVCRSGSSWGMWFDGTSINTATNASAISSAASQLYIGNSASGDGFGGYIDDLRITKGVARYTPGVNFTPPTTAFPNS